MRYLPPTPGISFLDRTTIGCGLVRGGPYRYSGQSLEQKPECDTWPERWAQRIGHDQARCRAVDRSGAGRPSTEMHGSWTHIGDPDFDQYLEGELRRALDILRLHRRHSSW